MYKIVGITPIENCSIYRVMHRNLVQVIYERPHIDVFIAPPEKYPGYTYNRFPFYLLFKHGKLKTIGGANGFNACEWIDKNT